MLKVLGALGKTLAIVPIEEALKEEEQFGEQAAKQEESISGPAIQLISGSEIR